jgi:hypothetical protein
MTKTISLSHGLFLIDTFELPVGAQGWDNLT